MRRRLAHFRNIHTIYLFIVRLFFVRSVARPVYLERNAAQTTDQLPMTLTVCGRDNFIARCSVVYATCAIARTHHIELQFGAPKNNRQPHTTHYGKIDWLLAGSDKQLIDWEIYWTFIRESSHISFGRSFALLAPQSFQWKRCIEKQNMVYTSELCSFIIPGYSFAANLAANANS